MPGGCEHAWVDLGGANAHGHYQDGCSENAGTHVYFNTQTRVNGGPCVNGGSDGSYNHKSICY